MLITIMQTILIYISNTVFVINGILTSRKKELPPAFQLLCGISSAFFGGMFLRDLALLHRIPVILGNPSEFLTAVLIGILAVHIMDHKTPDKLFSFLLNAADLTGVVIFATIGYQHGLSAEASNCICFASGFVTACGGGIIAAAIQAIFLKKPDHFIHTLQKNKTYYFFVALISAIQGILMSSF